MAMDARLARLLYVQDLLIARDAATAQRDALLILDTERAPEQNTVPVVTAQQQLPVRRRHGRGVHGVNVGYQQQHGR